MQSSRSRSASIVMMRSDPDQTAVAMMMLADPYPADVLNRSAGFAGRQLAAVNGGRLGTADAQRTKHKAE